MDFKKEGKATEKRLADRLALEGYVIKYSSKEEDMHDHWDISYDDIKVDVKGIKKRQRIDGVPDETIHWVELVTGHGTWGWLYGKANQFAFETEDYWILVDKIKLQNFIASKCHKTKVTIPELYKIFQRKNKLDCITLVKTIDLMAISDRVLSKIK